MKRSHQVLVAVGVVVAVAAAPFAWRWFKRAIGALVLLGAFVSPAAAAKKPKARPRPQPQLEVGLVLPIGFVQRGSTFGVRIRAFDPRHELNCPAWKLFCNDSEGHASAGASDCPDDFAMPEDRPLVYQLPEAAPVMCGPYWTPGEIALRVEITDSTHGPHQMSPTIERGGIVQISEAPPVPPTQVASR